MSYNIDSITILSGSLSVSRDNEPRASDLDLPESHNFDNGREPERCGREPFDSNGMSKLKWFWFSGEWSGRAYSEGVFNKLVALLDGEADLMITWEGGDSFTGVRIKNGRATEHKVLHTLGPKVNK